MGDPIALTADALDELALRCGRPMRLVCARWSRIINDATLTTAVEMANMAMTAVDRGDARYLIEIIITAAQGRRFNLARWIVKASVPLHEDMLRYDRVHSIHEVTTELVCAGASLLMADLMDAKLWVWCRHSYKLFMIADDGTARRIIAACPELAALHAHVGARRRNLIRRLVLPARTSDVDKMIDSPDSKEGLELRTRIRRDTTVSWLSVITRVVDLDREYVPLSECSLFNLTTLFVVYMLSLALYSMRYSLG